MIEGHFGDGSEFGLELSYSREERAARHRRAGSATRPASSATPSWSSPATRSPTSTWPRCASSTSPTTGSRPWRPSGSRDTSQFGVAITGADGRIQGFQEKPDPAEALSDLANCGIYMFRAEIFDFFPGAGHQQGGGRGRPGRLRRLGDGRLPGACSRATCPSTRTRSTPTGTTSATSRSCAQGNLDALHRRGRGRARRAARSPTASARPTRRSTGPRSRPRR